jgi:hypothetical protein
MIEHQIVECLKNVLYVVAPVAVIFIATQLPKFFQ